MKHTYKDPEEIKRNIVKAFKIFDANGDGFITRDEVKSALTKMGQGLSEQKFDKMMRMADRNGDGKIDYEGMRVAIVL